MQFGSFIIFGQKEEPKKLGLREAEQIYAKATGLIKSDESKGVPFAIMATATVLGADVTVCEECKRTETALKADATATQKEVEEEKRGAEREINRLYSAIDAISAETRRKEGLAKKRIEDLESRRSEVSEIRSFFHID
jgi:uncharacterized protein HemX